MGSDAVIQSIGLVLSANGAALPKGAMLQAENVVVRRPGVVEPRNGFEAYGDSVSGATRIFSFQGGMLLCVAGVGVYAKFSTAAATAWTLISSLSGSLSTPPSAGRIAPGLDADYLPLRNDIYRVIYNASGISASMEKAGAPRAASFDKETCTAVTNAGQMSRAGTTVTVNTTAAHGYYVGQVIQMTSAGEANFTNGAKTVVTVPSSTQFTYTEAGAAAASGAQQTFAIPRFNGATGWLSDGYQVAYRFCINAPIANRTERLGAVSSRFTQPNQTGETGYTAATARNPIVRALLPSDATTSHYIQVYRSVQVAVGTEPSDELGQVYEAKLTSTDISRGYVDITDVVPDGFRGRTIYTAPSQEGIENNNEKPPLAETLSFFGGSLHIAETQTRGAYEFSLVVVGSGGLANMHTVTVGASTFTGTTAAIVGASSGTNFPIETGGSAAQNIRNTALNLCAAVNRTTACTFSAFYVSGPDDLPGRILLVQKDMSRDTSAALNAATTAPAAAFVPSYSSDNFPNYLPKKRNRVWHSKDGQPDAVPLGNYNDLGSQLNEVMAIIPLRSGQFAFTKEGLFRGTGAGGRFQWRLFDPTVKLMFPRAAVFASNRIYALATEGLVAVSESGVERLSGPLSQLFSSSIAFLQADDASSFIIASEAVEELQIHIGGSNTGLWTFVYNYGTGAWTTSTLLGKDGASHEFGKYGERRYLLRGNRAHQEKPSSSADGPFTVSTDGLYDDEFATVTINSIANVNELTLASSLGLSVGDVLWQTFNNGSDDLGVTATIEEINGNVVTVNAAQTTYSAKGSFSAGSASVRKKYDCTMVWAPFGVDGFQATRFWGANFYFDAVALNTAAVSFASSSDQDMGITANWEALPEGLSILNTMEEYRASLGQLALTYTDPGNSDAADRANHPFWLTVGDAGGYRNVRCDVPQSKSEGSMLFVKLQTSQAGGYFRLCGIKVDFEDSSPRTPR